MYRIGVEEARVNFARLVERVCSEGICIQLESGDRVVACLTPPMPTSKLQVSGLDSFLRKLPDLDDDIDAFSGDVEAIRRELPPETDPWA
jgi:antitoxin (DNA-binding transcriptional repressor) of toxin-antitoxin stability system